jgi:hypothetical protein
MKVKSLLICDDQPSASYGTGQRLLAIQRALHALGECRVLHLTNDPSNVASVGYFVAPLPFDPASSRRQWIWRRLTFGELRPDKRYEDVLKEIRQQYAFDILVCSFLRNLPVIPSGAVPSLIDVDAIPERTGVLERILWPLTRLLLRCRARDFGVVYVIRQSDERLFGSELKSRVRLLPAISATGGPPFQPGSIRRKRVLFVAPTAWPPNKHAVDWLLSIGTCEVLASRGFELRIVGGGTETLEKRRGLSAAGFVRDLDEEYAAAELVLCPIFSGGGANIKLAEAVQYGCAVLASARAALAFDGVLVPGRDVEVFQRADQFLSILVDLLGDEARLGLLRSNACSASVRILNQANINQIIAADVNRLLSGHLSATHG